MVCAIAGAAERGGWGGAFAGATAGVEEAGFLAASIFAVGLDAGGALAAGFSTALVVSLSPFGASILASASFSD